MTVVDLIRGFSLATMHALLIGSGFGVAPAEAQVTYYVNGGCGSDAWTGAASVCQFPNGPKSTIQAALDAASPGDQIVVSPGRYFENLVFAGKNVLVRATHPSVNLSDPLDAALASIIDGSRPNNSAIGCSVCYAGTESASCMLDGFTITGGTGFFDTSGGFRQGGGIYGGQLGSTWSWSLATISNCTITGNSARFGAGISKCGGLITRCRIYDNSTQDPGGSNHGGGGMQACNGIIVDCEVVDNHAFEGAGLYSCRGTIRDCTIARNQALWSGGGLIYCDDATFVNSMICDNRASVAGNGLGAGGAVFSSRATYINCTIANNSAMAGGGFYGYQQFTPTLRNCIVWGNTAQTGPQVLLRSTTLPTVMTISYTDLQGGVAGVSLGDANCSVNAVAVMVSDPLFANSAAGDYHLSGGTLCIDAGSNALIPTGILTDRDGAPRRVDDPGTPDAGAGTVPIVDLGAFEFRGVTCPADFNHDLLVDFFDYLDFVAAFAGSATSADFNLDGYIDFFDYLDFVQAFSAGC